MLPEAGHQGLYVNSTEPPASKLLEAIADMPEASFLHTPTDTGKDKVGTDLLSGVTCSPPPPFFPYTPVAQIRVFQVFTNICDPSKNVKIIFLSFGHYYFYVGTELVHT